MFCPNCGNQMSDGAVFCGNCGWSKTGKKGRGGQRISLPIVPIIGVIAIIAIVFLVKNVFLGGSFKSAKLVTKYSTDTSIDKMKTVKFGSYPQSDMSGNTKEPIEWIVLDRQGNKTLLLSKYILDCKCYNNEFTDVTWETCSLRNWLNNDFYYKAFSSDEQKKIVTTNVVNNNNIDYGTNGGNNTNDKVFCLSIEEVQKYFGNGIKQDYGYQLGKNVATRGTDYSKVVNNNGSYLWVYDGSGDSQYSWAVGNSWWWLRSPGNNQSTAAGVSHDGYLNTVGHYVDDSGLGVRPALWVEN